MKFLKYLTYGGWPILAIPFFVGMLGVTMNELVIWANHLQMPVAMPNCQVLMDAAQDMGHNDPVHTCMTHATHLKWMGDILIGSDGVASIGDYLQGMQDQLAHMALLVWFGFIGYCAYLRRNFYLE